MKVVLLKDVKNMGRAGSVHDVSDGHGLNMLIPKKLAVLATAGAMKKADAVAKLADTQREVESKRISERLGALAQERIVVLKKANEQGHLYDTVDAKDIAEVTQLPVEAISLEKPFKELGTFEVQVAYGANFGSISVTIEAE